MPPVFAPVFVICNHVNQANRKLPRFDETDNDNDNNYNDYIYDTVFFRRDDSVGFN